MLRRNPHKPDSALPFIGSLLAIAVIAILIVVGCSGCAGLQTALYRPILQTNAVPALTVTNLTVITNIVILPPATNEVTGEVKPAEIQQQLQPVFTITELPPRTEVITNGWEKRPEVFESAAVIGQALPGAGPLIAGLFGAAGTIGAALSTAKARRNAKLANATEAGLLGTIQGIEEIRRALQTTPEGRALDKSLVDALEAAQRDHGALDVVQKLIEVHTGYTTKTVDLSQVFTAPAPALAPAPQA